jgi:hypothetical protein
LNAFRQTKKENASQATMSPALEEKISLLKLKRLQQNQNTLSNMHSRNKKERKLL